MVFVGEKIDEAGGVSFSTVAGSDFVTDIPYHRWDHELYYDSDPNCWLQVLPGKLWVGFCPRVSGGGVKGGWI